MKKLYAIMLALMPLAVSAQTITLTVDGQEVKNGETKTIVYDTDVTYALPEWDFYEYGFAPEVLVSCGEDALITGFVYDNTRTADAQCCWPTTCQKIGEGYMSKDVEMSANVAQNMQIHVQTEAHSETSFSYSLSFKFENVDEDVLFEATVILLYNPTNAIKAAKTDRQPTRIYNLRGQQVRHLQKGLNIMGGKKVVVK